MSRSVFRVGTVEAGKLYFFTALGEFRSHADAVAAYTKLPRIGAARAVIVETRPAWRLGVEYGHNQIVRDLSGRVC